MNRISILAIAAAAATLAFATAPAHAAVGAGEGTAGYPHEMQAVSGSTLSRADVLAQAQGERSVVYTQPQLAQLKAAGERATTIVVAAQR
jgi:hypothetical protein